MTEELEPMEQEEQTEQADTEQAIEPEMEMRYGLWVPKKTQKPQDTSQD